METLSRRNPRRYLLAAAAAAALSALIVFAYLRGITARVAQSGRLVELVVAARDLGGGEVLDGSSLQLVPFPDRYLLPGTFTELSPLTGRRLSHPVRQGEPILESALLSGGMEELQESVAPGFRAFPLPQEAVNFPLSFLPPRGRVDILFVEGSMARLGLENVRVLSAAPAAESGGSSWETPSGLSSSAKDICLLLEVTPEEACLLAAALKEGGVEVILRPRGD